MKRIRIGEAWYVVADDPIDMTQGPEDVAPPKTEGGDDGESGESGESAPTATEVVDDVEEEPSAEWRDTYLKAVFTMIRNLFDLQKGQVVLLGPSKTTEYVSDAYGFDIVGHIRFEGFEPDQSKYGAPPYRFSVNVNPEGELSTLILVEGQQDDRKDVTL